MARVLLLALIALIASIAACGHAELTKCYGVEIGPVFWAPMASCWELFRVCEMGAKNISRHHLELAPEQHFRPVSVISANESTTVDSNVTLYRVYTALVHLAPVDQCTGPLCVC